MSLFAEGVWFGFNSQCSLQWKTAEKQNYQLSQTAACFHLQKS